MLVWTLLYFFNFTLRTRKYSRLLGQTTPEIFKLKPEGVERRKAPPVFQHLSQMLRLLSFVAPASVWGEPETILLDIRQKRSNQFFYPQHESGDCEDDDQETSADCRERNNEILFLVTIHEVAKKESGLDWMLTSVNRVWKGVLRSGWIPPCPPKQRATRALYSVFYSVQSNTCFPLPRLPRKIKVNADMLLNLIFLVFNDME